MGFIKDIQKVDPPFVVRGNFNDPYLWGITERILNHKYNITEIDKDNSHMYSEFDDGLLFSPSKPECNLVNNLELQLSFKSLKSFATRNSIIVMDWKQNLPLDIPEIYIQKMSLNSTTLASLKEWSSYLGFNSDISLDTWKEIFNSSYEVFLDIEKTLLAYGKLTPENYFSIHRQNQNSIHIVELVKALVTGNIKNSCLALEKAWESKLDVTKIIEWFMIKLDLYLNLIKKGVDPKEASRDLGISGKLGSFLFKHHKEIDASIITRTWKILGEIETHSGKAKDLMLILGLFNKL